MEIETLKRSHLKRNIIIGVVVVAIISAIILNFTRAKYRTTQSIPLVNGTINYSAADLNIVAITVDGEPSDTIPEGSYELTEESYCTVDGEEDSSITLSYDSNTQTLTIIPFTTRGTKCYLRFDTKSITPQEIIASKNIATRDDFSITLTQDTTGTIYSAEDDDGTTYYFAGNPSDNWVYFAGFYWRIIRINGDGTIRLIYNGTNTTTTGIELETTAYNANSNDNAYVGYMYGAIGSSNYEATHTNTNDSTIKSVLERWYEQNLMEYDNYISNENGFCGDRVSYTNSSGSSTGNGFSTNATYYGGYIRLNTNKLPTFTCTNNNDLYTANESTIGNKVLTYPIGLITADEVAYAGGVWNNNNENYYLYTDQSFWTISPSWYFKSGMVMNDGWASVFYINEYGALYYLSVTNTSQIRPVINLRANVTITGSGTSIDPYIIN